MKRLLAILLHYANRKPPITRKQEFYAVKTKILTKYGQKTGNDIQHIHKECYSCFGTGNFNMFEECWKCNGTGVYDQFWTLLAKYKFCGYEFHQPVAKFFENPGYRTFGKIEGYINHKPPKYYLAEECAFWLFLLYDRKTFFGMMGNVGYSSKKFTPMVILSTIIQKAKYFRFSDLIPGRKEIYELDDDLPF